MQAKEDSEEKPIIMSGEIDMFKRTLKRTVSVVAIAVVVPLAGCSGEPGRLSAILDAFNFVDAFNSVGVFNSGASMQREGLRSAEVLELAQPSAAELRHFAAYNNYRALFDGAPYRVLNSFRKPDDAKQNAGSASVSKGIGEAFSACSFRAFIAQDW
jgi:hypothetical protein